MTDMPKAFKGNLKLALELNRCKVLFEQYKESEKSLVTLLNPYIQTNDIEQLLEMADYLSPFCKHGRRFYEKASIDRRRHQNPKPL